MLYEHLGEEIMERWLSIRDARNLLANMAKNAHSQEKGKKESPNEKNSDRDAEGCETRNGNTP